MLAAVGVMALSTGPIFVLAMTLMLSIAYPADLVRMGASSLASVLVRSLFYGLVPGLPLSVVHAVAIDLLARRGRDSIGISFLSGIALSLLPAAGFILLIMADGSDIVAITNAGQLWAMVLVAMPFASAGALLGALFWRIVIYHRRQVRLAALHDDAAIQAME
jgi:hypothetical protein